MEARVAVVVVNRAGLHARPCHALVSAALGFQSQVSIRCAGREVDGRSILSLMTLEAARGAELEIVAHGPDADRVVDSLAALVREGFGESD